MFHIFLKDFWAKYEIFKQIKYFDLRKQTKKFKNHDCLNRDYVCILIS